MEAAESTAAPLGLGRGWKRGRLVVVALPLLVVFVALGSLGTVYYLRGFWLYRGFPPPHDPAFVVSRGTALHIEVPSAALGGRSQQVDVYLPPGYASHPRRRYPVLYLLHGFPGRPGAFLSTVKEGVNEDVLVALHRMQPLILVMPYGSTGTFTDKEWANGVRPKEAWETFVARDVVHAVDARFRTIRRGAGRAIGGLSEGGYGAINIALHHPREFRVVESWSGYERADPLVSIFGRGKGLLAWNSPLVRLPKVASVLRAQHTYMWFYVGSGDGGQMQVQNTAFATELAKYRIPHWFADIRGGHNWAVWRARGGSALLAAAGHLAHG